MTVVTVAITDIAIRLQLRGQFRSKPKGRTEFPFHRAREHPDQSRFRVTESSKNSKRFRIGPWLLLRCCDRVNAMPVGPGRQPRATPNYGGRIFDARQVGGSPRACQLRDAPLSGRS